MRRRVIHCNLNTFYFLFLFLVFFGVFFSSSVYYFLLLVFVLCVCFSSSLFNVFLFVLFVRFLFFRCLFFSTVFFVDACLYMKRPGARYLEETMSTLRYADQAKSIVNSVRINEDPFARTVRRLNLEVTRQGGRQARLSACNRSRENLVVSEQHAALLLYSGKLNFERSELAIYPAAAIQYTTCLALEVGVA